MALVFDSVSVSVQFYTILCNRILSVAVSVNTPWFRINFVSQHVRHHPSNLTPTKTDILENYSKQSPNLMFISRTSNGVLTLSDTETDNDEIT